MNVHQPRFLWRLEKEKEKGKKTVASIPKPTGALLSFSLTNTSGIYCNKKMCTPVLELAFVSRINAIEKEKKKYHG